MRSQTIRKGGNYRKLEFENKISGGKLISIEDRFRGEKPKQTISRVLFFILNEVVTINLGLLLPAGSSNQPESIGRAALKHFPI